jgi:hypothetical protein
LNLGQTQKPSALFYCGELRSLFEFVLQHEESPATKAAVLWYPAHFQHDGVEQAAMPGGNNILAKAAWAAQFSWLNVDPLIYFQAGSLSKLFMSEHWQHLAVR